MFLLPVFDLCRVSYFDVDVVVEIAQSYKWHKAIHSNLMKAERKYIN